MDSAGGEGMMISFFGTGAMDDVVLVAILSCDRGGSGGEGGATESVEEDVGMVAVETDKVV